MEPKPTTHYTAQAAQQRVLNTPELAQHYDTLFYDWPNFQEHIDWICTASVADIVEWCEITGD